MDRLAALLVLPVIVLIVSIGAIMTGATGGWDYFPYGWFSFTAALTVAFITLIRLAFGPEDEESHDAAAKGESHAD